MLERYELNVSL